MKRFKFSLLALLLLSITVHANDSTGYVGVGGAWYIKNPNIAMKSEDLYISKDIIKVAYEFKNLTNKPIHQTVLFPLPAVPVWTDYDFADVQETLASFNTLVNGKPVRYKTYARAFMRDDKLKLVDVTAEFKACGVSEQDVVKVWDNTDTLGNINEKLGTCNNAKLQKLIGEYDPSLDRKLAVLWEGQVIYEFEQTFAPNAITRISHSYRPMVGGGVFFDESLDSNFCLDKATRQNLDKKAGTHPLSYSALGYVLTTGANWAKPIERFKLTVERDSDEIVSFCWAGRGKVKKVGQGKFEVIENNFVPKQDIDVAFIRVK